MKLVIVESPAKCQKIEGYLGNGYKCVASFGHITGITNGLKDIDISNGFKAKFSTLPQKSKNISLLRTQIKKASEIILATDDDREGEAIAWHICNLFKLPLKTTKRIIFNEITKPALLNAIQNPTIVNMNKVNAQQARQVLDLIVGYTISPILWKHISRKKQLSGGRCQTPALRIIYDNENEIKKNPGKLVYETILFYNDLPFKLNNHFTKEKAVEEFLNSNITHQHELYTEKVRENIVKKPPIPLTTSILQQKASNELHYSPKRTMQIAQKLYEAGHITYMRTDSKKYSVKFLKELAKFVKDTYGNNYVSKNYMKLSNKVKKQKNDNSQEAHEAIRPTHISKENMGKDVSQKNLYNLIRNITLESCMIPANYKSICAVVTSPEKYLFKHSEEQVVEPGWKVVRGYEKVNKHFSNFEKIKSKKKIKYDKIESKAHLKDKKLHFTEAKLVQTLEKKGIGRPSTFSNIISKIQDRGYVKKTDVIGKKKQTTSFTLINSVVEKKSEESEFGTERNKLVLQTTGKIVIEFLIKHFDEMFVYDYTKNMEDDLDKISKGKMKRVDVCSICYNQLVKLSNEIKMDHREMFNIDDHHVYMIGKYGPVIRKDLDGETTFLSVKKDLDIEKIKSGSYTLEQMVEPKKSNIILGKFKNNDVFLKKGKYGMYVQCNGESYSIKHIKKKMEKVVLKDVLGVLEGKKNTNVLLEINSDLSIRKGKYGDYIFYKKENMKKPKFLNLKKKKWRNIPADELLVWIQNEYNI